MSTLKNYFHYMHACMHVSLKESNYSQGQEQQNILVLQKVYIYTTIKVDPYSTYHIVGSIEFYSIQAPGERDST